MIKLMITVREEVSQKNVNSSVLLFSCVQALDLEWVQVCP